MNRQKFSGAVVYRRKIFGDPVITVYYLRGEPIYAESFLVKRRWWEGLLSEEEAENQLFGDIFGYASKVYRDSYAEHLRKYAKEIISIAEEIIKDFGWELDIEKIEYSAEDISSMFHISLAEKQVINENESKERKIVSNLNALGFLTLYISSEDGRWNDYGFSKTLGFMKRTVDEIMQKMRETNGSFALVLPLYIIAHLDTEERKVWIATKDIYKLAFALNYLKPAENISENLLKQITFHCCKFVIWKTHGDTFSLFDGTKTQMLNLTDIMEKVDKYLKDYDRILREAQSRMPSNVPPKMKEMLLHKMVIKNPDIRDFAEEFASHFSITLDYEKS